MQIKSFHGTAIYTCSLILSAFFTISDLQTGFHGSTYIFSSGFIAKSQ